MANEVNSLSELFFGARRLALYLLLSVYLRVYLGMCAAGSFVKHIHELSDLDREKCLLLSSSAFLIETRLYLLRDG